MKGYVFKCNISVNALKYINELPLFSKVKMIKKCYFKTQII